MELSLVIPTFNRCTDLISCLESILRQNLSVDRYEVIVIDNGPSTDETALHMALYVQRFAHMSYIQTDQKGCVSARVLGFAQARGEIVLTLDDDVEFLDANTLIELLRVFNDPTIGMVGALEWRSPTQITATTDARRQHTSHKQIGRISLRGVVQTQFESLYGLHTGVDVDHFRSCFMAIRKTIYEQVGGFMLVYSADGMGFRYETDLCMVVKEYGYRVVLAPFLRIWHKAAEGKSTFDTGILERRLYLKKRNHTFFMLRHFWRHHRWFWFLYEICVGTERVPGIIYLMRQKNISVANFRAVVQGVVAGYRLYFNTTV